MSVKIQSNSATNQKDGPSKAIQRAWDKLRAGAGDPIQYVEDRYDSFANEEKCKISTLANLPNVVKGLNKAKQKVKKLSKKTKDKYIKECKRTFAATKWKAIETIEFVHTHQRVPVGKTIIDILLILCAMQTNTIKLAQLKEKGKTRYICYDGQHTLIVLYLLGFKRVPVEIKIVSNIADVRTLFRNANGKGLHRKVCNWEDNRQEVLRYEEDGIRDAAAKQAHRIDRLLKKNHMAMSGGGTGKIRNTVSRINELQTLKNNKLGQMYIDCYKHRTKNNIDIDKYPALGSKESRFYDAAIKAGWTVKQINNITDFLDEVRGTSVAYHKSDFWLAVKDFSGGNDGTNAISYIRNEHETDDEMKDFGVKL